MQVSIIGTGKMGEWFARYLKTNGADVIVFDIDSKKAEKVAKVLGVGEAKTLEEALDSDLVFIAVSLSKTAQVVKKAGAQMKKAQVLVEIASLKSGVVEELQNLNCEILSMHPMFGPGIESIDRQNIILIKEVSTDQAREKVLPLLDGANITECSFEEHERLMAKVLSLPYAMNIAFYDIAKGVPDGMTGPTFVQQLSLAERVMGEEEDLKGELVKNPYAKELIENFVKRLKEIGCK